MTSIRECLQRADELDSDSARLDVELLLARVLDKGRTYLYTWPDQALSDSQLEAFESLFKQRRQGRPVAHLLGEREFWGLDLSVDASTLIPRADTETLVEVTLELEVPENASVLDLGTGTGAIALALASEKRQWQLLAVDRSEDAVALAEGNRRKLGLENVAVRQSDWFQSVDASGFHIIVSNPPYIDAADPHLQQGDVRFEPLTALVAEDQGLADIQHIIDSSRDYLIKEGWLLLEHGYRQAQAVRELMLQAGYDSVRTRQDLGGNDRVTLGKYL